MNEVAELPPLRDVIRRHGLSAKKSLGQNFLLDLNLTGRIARAAGPLDGATVIEIGPGPGRLTRALAAQTASVRALDVSPRMLELARRYRSVRRSMAKCRPRPFCYATGASPHGPGRADFGFGCARRARVVRENQRCDTLE